MRKTLLRLGFLLFGLLMATGIIFVFIPREAMVSIGKLYNLPPFEVTPVFDYMARCLSFTAFLAGVGMIYAAFHLAELSRMLRFAGWVTIASIPIIVWIHACAGLPRWWLVGDLIGLAIFAGLCFLVPQTEVDGKLDSRHETPVQ